MDPKSVIDQWIIEHSFAPRKLAMKYIEKNIELLETDIDAFLNRCPEHIYVEVRAMLAEADIPVPSSEANKSSQNLKYYMYDGGSRYQQYYTIDYTKKMDEYITKAIEEWKADWRYDTIVLDTIPAVEEA